MRSRSGIQYKTNEEIRKCRRAALIVRQIHKELVAAAKPGVSTGELDRIAKEVLDAAGAVSNFYGYYDYPAQTCISVNDTVVHGIPSDTEILQPGDIVSFDCGSLIDGWNGDSCYSVVIPGGDPEVTARRERLSELTRQAMWVGIAAMATGKYVGDIGEAIDDFATSQDPEPGIVEDFTGHGIGKAMHEPPNVFNYATAARGPRLRPGMVLCIEPIFTEGDQANHTLADGWTTKTNDGSDACHWESQVALHKGGIWVLNEPDGGAAGLAPFGITPVPLED
ncbi:methionyl aminopeptidase [Actinobaculum suis]|uniref:Methionine aminopeptidase n=1 Tax=Actinobaculum suis TaxID=1657 RepID=A0A1G7AUK2_9ACTO|nr:type I methionyl aminopeptidase [Actinobaculum suis]MDY5153453.1 type I methionyl aminopeptidase [Actinobaculum suis]SDE18554.1 methionyl aminopeptidase [Actinobaculum suis]VDG76009.1 methionine aminopeptidase [Actinobaculum suis]